MRNCSLLCSAPRSSPAFRRPHRRCGGLPFPGEQPQPSTKPFFNLSAPSGDRFRHLVPLPHARRRGAAQSLGAQRPDELGPRSTPVGGLGCLVRGAVRRDRAGARGLRAAPCFPGDQRKRRRALCPRGSTSLPPIGCFRHKTSTATAPSRGGTLDRARRRPHPALHGRGVAFRAHGAYRHSRIEPSPSPPQPRICSRWRGACAEDVAGVIDPQRVALPRLVAVWVAIAATALSAAVFLAFADFDVLQAVVTAFAFSAATFFPALLLAIWWRRCTLAWRGAGARARLRHDVPRAFAGRHPGFEQCARHHGYRRLARGNTRSHRRLDR